MKKTILILSVFTGAFLLSNCSMPAKHRPTAQKRGSGSSANCCSNTCCCCFSKNSSKK